MLSWTLRPSPWLALSPTSEFVSFTHGQAETWKDVDHTAFHGQAIGTHGHTSVQDRQADGFRISVGGALRFLFVEDRCPASVLASLRV